jgi:hypothetical protein
MYLHIRRSVAKKSSIAILTVSTIFGFTAYIGTVQAQTSTSNNSQPASIGSNSFDNVISPINNQNNNQSQANPNNIINVPNIYPLQTPLVAPVNTENDFGMNFSLGVNTLDSSNVTAYIGVIFQPGRTDSHLARMQRLSKETDLLDQQKRLLEAQVALLQQQVEEAKLRVEQIRKEQTVGSIKNNQNAQSSIINQERFATDVSSKILFPPAAAIGYSFSGTRNMDESNQGGALSNTPNGGLFPMIPDGR